MTTRSPMASGLQSLVDAMTGATRSAGDIQLQSTKAISAMANQVLTRSRRNKISLKISALRLSILPRGRRMVMHDAPAFFRFAKHQREQTGRLIFLPFQLPATKRERGVVGKNRDVEIGE